MPHVLRAWRDPALTAPMKTFMSSLLSGDLDALVASASLPAHVAAAFEQRNHLPFEVFTRMCHSALVDADFLDTAAHFAGRDQPHRTTAYGMRRWLEQFRRHYAERFSGAPPSELNAVRAEVFEACVSWGERSLPPGIYRLPAPTGTGKTMAAAAFALNHAVAFGKARVIVAVPFTTITTQNAAVYRAAFGDLAPSLLEHHSNIVDEAVADDTWRRLSAPGWDAEFIVTTTVQLFESLFSNRPSQTRKLHRIANSVIVLDEVQALPIELLSPILQMLRELVEHYRRHRPTGLGYPAHILVPSGVEWPARARHPPRRFRTRCDSAGVVCSVPHAADLGAGHCPSRSGAPGPADSEHPRGRRLHVSVIDRRAW